MEEGAGGRQLPGPGGPESGRSFSSSLALGPSAQGSACQGAVSGWHGMDRGSSDLSDHRRPPLLPNAAACGAGDVWRLRGRVSTGSGWPHPGRSLLAVAAQEPPGSSSLLLVWLQVPSRRLPLARAPACSLAASALLPLCLPHVLHVTPGLHRPAQSLLQGPHALGQRAPDSPLPPGTWGPLQPIQALGGASGSERAHWTRHHAAEVPLRGGGALPGR